MGTVADTSLRALHQEKARLRYPLWLQRHLFFRKAKGIHGVHSPLAYQLATTVFMNPTEAPIAARLQEQLGDIFFQNTAIAHLPAALTALAGNETGALWVPQIKGARAAWLDACADARVTLTIDCFDSGLLLRTPDVKEKQYLRQRYRK